MRVLSLGAGVQSTTLLLLANHGELPGGPVDCAIFADTGWEPKVVYEHLDWLESVSAIPIHRTSRGNLRRDAMDHTLSHAAAMPVYVDGAKGAAIANRQCTREFKIRPIERKLRELLGVSRRARLRPNAVESLLGLSLDEVGRMKPSRQPWITVSWPLIDLRMTRHDCLLWLQRHGYPEPPKSACIGCPFHSDAYWRQLFESSPDEWDDACDFDDALRDGRAATQAIKYPAYLHRSLIPLRQVDLSTPVDRGQLDLFQAECEGMCGV